MRTEQGIGRFLSEDESKQLVAGVRYEITTTDEEIVEAGRGDVVRGYSEIDGRILEGGEPPLGVPVVLVLEDGRRWFCFYKGNGQLRNSGGIK